MAIEAIWLGRMDYQEAWDLQRRIWQEVHDGTRPDTLLLVEHPPVLTMGRRAHESNLILNREQLSALGVSVYDVERGGDVTYHGPGQLVGYPIFNITKRDRDVRRFVWNLEEVIIRLLHDDFGIEAIRGEGTYTGVYAGTEKLCAFGIAVKHGVSLHGYAFNVTTDLTHFNWIVPCGLTDRTVASVQSITGRSVPLDTLIAPICRYTAAVFNEPVDIKQERFE